MVERQSAQPAKRQSIDGELFDGFNGLRIRFEIQNMDQAVSDLENVDVAGERFAGFELDRDMKVEPFSEMLDVGKLEKYRHCDRYGNGIIDQHEFLERLVAELVLGHRLQHEPRGFDCCIGGFGSDADFIDIKKAFVLRTAFLIFRRLAE